MALALKLVGGFSVGEIARAFLVAGIGDRPAACARQAVAARRADLVRHARAGRSVASALDSVLDTLYLMFNEGYAATSGDQLDPRRSRRRGDRRADRDACDRRAHPATGLRRQRAWAPASGADAAACGAVSRRASIPKARCSCCAIRIAASGTGRSIAEGMRALDRASAGDRISAFHLEAGIAACHAAAASWESTDWPQIVELYDELLALTELAGRRDESRRRDLARRGSRCPAWPRSTPSTNLDGARPLSAAAGDPGGAVAGGRRRRSRHRVLPRRARPCALRTRAALADLPAVPSRIIVGHVEYLIKQYALEPGAWEIQYIEEYFGEFPRRKTADEIIDAAARSRVPDPDGRSAAARRSDRRAGAGVLQDRPRDPRRRIGARSCATSSTRLDGSVNFDGRRILYSWIGGTRRDWRGQGHFRALTEESEVWAMARRLRRSGRQGQEPLLRHARRARALQFNVVKHEPHATDSERVEGLFEQAAAGRTRARPSQRPHGRLHRVIACKTSSPLYSAFSVTTGSTCVPRRAGRYDGDDRDERRA